MTFKIKQNNFPKPEHDIISKGYIKYIFFLKVGLIMIFIAGNRSRWRAGQILGRQGRKSSTV